MAKLIDYTVAETIYRQIGHIAMVMIGAKNHVAGDNLLGFKIGRNAGGWNYIRVELTGMDLYDMTFLRIWNMEVREEKKVEGLYFDQLRQVIRTNTGMATSL
jgi:hypothetical protein